MALVVLGTMIGNATVQQKEGGYRATLYAFDHTASILLADRFFSASSPLLAASSPLRPCFVLASGAGVLACSSRVLHGFRAASFSLFVLCSSVVRCGIPHASLALRPHFDLCSERYLERTLSASARACFTFSSSARRCCLMRSFRSSSMVIYRSCTDIPDRWKAERPVLE